MDINDQYNISIHGSHNGGVVVEKNGDILVLVEFERFFNIKNMGITQYKTHRHPTNMIILTLDWIKRKYGVSQFENCFFSCADFTAQVGVSDFRYKSIYLTDYIDAKNYIHVTHHDAHANGGFYQSPFQESLLFSFDGGGDDGEFNV